jgi:hypothetical protein
MRWCSPLPVSFVAALAAWLATPVAAAARQVSLTVYNQDLALVREVRSLPLPRGRGEVRLGDVAARLDPTSVHLVPSRSGAFQVLEQNFQYDLASAERLLERSLGATLSATSKSGEVTEGKLVFFDASSLVLETPRGVRMLYRSDLSGQVIPALPGGLVSRPTLSWWVDGAAAGAADAELSYLTGGMSWHAEYVALVHPDDTALTLSSWVSVDNRSGAGYPDAKLKLVAGDVHRVREEIRALRARGAVDYAALEAEAPFEERGLFEYHLYELQRPTTVADRETKQIALFHPASVRQVEKKFTFDAERLGPKVVVTLEFENRSDHGLGMALPGGKVRVYKQDEDRSQEFVGEDRIDHTPKNEKVRLTVGRPFDVVAERKQTALRRISDRVSEVSYEIEVRNRKTEAIPVLVVEHPQGDWEVTEKSHDFTKKDAFTIDFSLRVPADGTVKVAYTLRTRH